MKTVEEQIWDYIDGNCSAAESAEIEAKIAADTVYQNVYKEFSELNQQISTIDLDEPSMAFNRNIMEMIKLEAAPVSLKTKLDNKIIYSIAAFFAVLVLIILGYSVSHATFTESKSFVNVDITRFITPAMIKIFIFADILIGFLFLDSLLRRKKQMS